MVEKTGKRKLMENKNKEETVFLGNATAEVSNMPLYSC